MANHLVNLPLSSVKVAKEIDKIVEIGQVNGYRETAIMHIIRKHQSKRQLRDISTFYDMTKPDEPAKRVAVRYYPTVTNIMRPIYREFNLELVHRNAGSMRQAIGTVKDVPLDLHKSGIYRIQCSHCGRYYYGMTIRKLFVRFNEHIKSANWKRKSAVGKHIFSSNHQIHISELKLIQQVQQMWKIEYFEAIYIHKNKHLNLLNVDDGNITSQLLNLFVLERKIDTDVIDITEDTPNSSIDESFYDAEE